ncbi:carboxypeptidase-like regulatory domain-containing protein [Dokdonella ginsengisoli]|uniref:Carboxypeptidase-like regulatory domain-containing protein n=1 Tax=Dokdonella ginsengisoli TaxID=363846 RepID=A0ABV9QTZ2_9GAMM
MTRFASFPLLALVLCSTPAFAANCQVSGTVYDFQGRPLRDAVVRLVDLDTRQARFVMADAQAAFTIHADAAPDYRLDVLSEPTRVTGSNIPTRSILGMTSPFACQTGQAARQDVRVQIE